MRDSEVNLKTFSAIAFIAIAFNICAAQTASHVSDNRYSIRDDVRIGRKAAVEIEKRLPIVSQRSLADTHIENVGRRLARAIPSRYQHRGFVYRFDVVNVRDINAFALPGGPRHVNRRLIGGLIGAPVNGPTMAPAPSMQQAIRRGN